MNTVLVLVFSSVLLQSTHVTCSCVACKYGTPKDMCTDVFHPSGPESEICFKINTGLCEKYGDYAIYCQTGGYSYSCSKKGQCGSGTRFQLAPCLLLTSVLLTVLMTFKR